MSQQMTPRQEMVVGVVREMLEANLGDTVYECKMAGGATLPWITCQYNGTSVTVVSTGESADGTLSIATTAGLGRDVPLSTELMHWVNEKNKGIKFGRVFYQVEQDPNLCTVVLQEYVSGDYVRADDIESQLAVLASVGPTMASGWSLSSELIDTCGGRYFDRGDAWLVTFIS